MIKTVDDRMKRKLTKNGSVLKYMASFSAGAAGCIAGGLVLLFASVLIIVMMSAGDMDILQVAVVSGMFALPGLLLVLSGIAVKCRYAAVYMKKYQKKSGLTEGELRKMEGEFLEPGTLVLVNDGSSRGRNLETAGFLTEHYFKLPGNVYYVRKISDIVSFFYTNRIRFGDGGYGSGLAVLAKNDKEPVTVLGVSEAAGKEIVKAVVEKHPSVIGSNPFRYREDQYDVFKDCKEVKELHARVVSGVKEQ